MSVSQVDRAKAFHASHRPGQPLLLANVWDVVGAKLVESLGFSAQATASLAVSYSYGVADDELVPVDYTCDLARRISKASPLPLTVDFERGFGEDHGELADNVTRLIASGAIGMNIEDSFGSGALRPLPEQVKRIEVVRRAADAVKVPFFINARTDAYMAPNNGSNRYEVAVERGKAFRDAGANGFYPVLCEPDDMAKLVREVDLPLNAFYTPKASLTQLSEWGVARVSLGPRLFHIVVTIMRSAAQAWLQGDDAGLIPSNTMNTADIGKLLGL